METKCFSCNYANALGVCVCLTCHRHFCIMCTDRHIQTNSKHCFTLTPANIYSLGQCSSHGRSLSFYCITCNIPICESCYDHRKHKFVNLYDKAKDLMPEIMNDVKSQLKKVETDKEKLEKKFSVCLSQWDRYLKTVNSINSDLKELKGTIEIRVHQTQLKLSEYISKAFEPNTTFLDAKENLKVRKAIYQEWEKSLCQIYSEKYPPRVFLMHNKLCQNLQKICVPQDVDTHTLALPTLVYEKPQDELVDKLFQLKFGEDPSNEHKASSSKQYLHEKDRETAQLNQIIKSINEELSIAKTTLEYVALNVSRLNAAYQRADVNKIVEFEWPENLANFPEIERHVKHFQSSMRKIEEFIERNQTILEKQQQTKEAHQDTTDKKEEEIRYRLESAKMESLMWQQKVNDLQHSLEVLNKECSSTKRQLERSQNEVEDFKTRLSEIAGAKLVSGNSSITDLSDKYRPTKIAEMYAELYDTEWTDAMDTILKSNSRYTDDMMARHLFVVLKACFHTCLNIATEQMTTLCQQMFLDVTPQKVASYMDIHVYEVKQMRDARRRIAYNMAIALTKNIFDNQHFKTICSGFKDIEMPLIQDIAKTKYFEKCVMVCWLMVVQDPAMYLDNDIKPGSPFIKERYKEYTKNGKMVEFTVWPALFLHKEGPLLTKGVVQVC